MTTYNRTNTQGVTPLSAQSMINGRVPAIIEQTIDFSLAGNVNVANDIFNAINVPAGFIVLASGVEVLKADTAGNSGTVQLKSGSTNQGSAVAPSSTGFLATVGTTTPLVASGSSAFMNLVIATGAINAVIRVFLVLLDIRARPGSGVVTGTGTAPDGVTVTQYQDPVKNYTTALVYVL